MHCATVYMALRRQCGELLLNLKAITAVNFWLLLSDPPSGTDLRVREVVSAIINSASSALIQRVQRISEENRERNDHYIIVCLHQRSSFNDFSNERHMKALRRRANALTH